MKPEEKKNVEVVAAAQDVLMVEDKKDREVKEEAKTIIDAREDEKEEKQKVEKAEVETIKAEADEKKADKEEETGP